MKRILLMLCLLCAGYAKGQTFANYLPLNGSTQFGAFGNNVLSGAAAFTIEYWIKTTESGSNGSYYQRPTMLGIATAGNTSGDFGITTNNGYIGFWHGLNSSNDQNYLSSSVQINNNAWHHIAVVNDGANATLYVDGASIASLPTGTGLITTNTPLTVGGSSLDFNQGGNNAVAVNFFHQGQYAEMRISNNVRYTTGFTPATSFTPDANTVSLLHFSGQCGVKALDAGTNHNDLIANNATASCSPLPFGSDFSFDGSTQYGITPAGLLDGLYTFTIEGWIKSTDLGVTPNGELWRAPNIVGNASNGGASGDFMVTTQAGFLTFYTGLNTSTGDNAITSKAFVSDNQWHHWAVSANGISAMLFADGIKVGMLPINRGLATAGNDAFGIMTNNSSCCGGAIYKHSGELDEVRFSNTARYSSNFTPPAASFTTDAATVALYHLNSFNCLSLYTPDAGSNNDSMLVYGYAGCAPDPVYPATTSAAGNVTGAEYFIDTDPGFGSGVSIPLTAAVNISNLTATIATSGLDAGIHRLYVRSRSAVGNWSITNERDFLISYDPPYGGAPAAAGNIIKAEYFIDTDPGFGSGTNMPLAAAVNISGLITSVNTASLAAGIHRLYVRSLSAEGRWSLTNERDFLVDYDPSYPSATPAPGNLAKAEYFIDTEPGFGNGNNITLASVTDVSGLVAGINTAGLISGTHRLYVRSLSAAGNWSITNERDFLVDTNPAYPPAPPVPGNITMMEYFFDADPGFGNGTAVSVTPAANISNYIVAVNTSALAAGMHTFFIRSLDAWSLTSARPLQVGNPLPLSWLAFSAAKMGDAVLLDWKVANERGNLRYDIERSADGSIFSSIGTTPAKTGSTDNAYSFRDEKPLTGLSYYRIRQEDAGGNFSYSATLPVRFGAVGMQVSIYPNPAAEVVHVVSENNADAQLRLYDAGGALVWSDHMSGRQADIPVSGIAAGTYQLIIIGKEGPLDSQKIVVRH